MNSFVCTVGGAITAVLLYYMVLRKLLARGKRKKISVEQFAFYVVITLYVLINMIEILFLVKYELNGGDYAFLILNAFFMILMHLYLFYILDTFAENKDLKCKLALYERQAQGNYDYYLKRREINKTAMAVIHDLRKHIQVMEELKQPVISSELKEYTNEFENTVLPLMVQQYCDNVILNTVIADKMDYCKKHDIHFHVDIRDVDLDFMEAIDITTIFGNILDNAIEACEKIKEKEREIHLKVHPFNAFIYIYLSNSCLSAIKWSADGKPVSDKGEYRGLGLDNVENVLERYDGNMQFSVEEQNFFVEIMISQP